jgi:hypothetical protein
VNGKCNCLIHKTLGCDLLALLASLSHFWDELHPLCDHYHIDRVTIDEGTRYLVLVRVVRYAVANAPYKIGDRTDSQNTWMRSLLDMIAIAPKCLAPSPSPELQIGAAHQGYLSATAEAYPDSMTTDTPYSCSTPSELEYFF